MDKIIEHKIADNNESGGLLNYEKDYHQSVYKDNTSDKYYEEKARLAVKKYFQGIPSDAKILDVGCGMGQNIYRMPNAVGYDISEYALDYCRRKGINVVNNLDLIPDGSIDIVFSSHTLEHLENPRDMLGTMKNKLKDSGKLILVLPVENHGHSSFELDINQHLFCWNFRTINNLLLVSGFKIISNQYLRGAGYGKLLSLSKINRKLYDLATQLMAYLFGIKEMKIVASKKI